MAIISKDIIKVQDLLEIKNLKIPEYQRPYKWTEKNVNQLIDDILSHKEKSTYRLGTVIIHNKKIDASLNIVDGQQRTFTLTLIAHALQTESESSINAKYDFSLKLMETQIENDIAKENFINNYSLIRKRINEFNNDAIKFFYEKCELIKIELDDISEAFQFFDSQNARGKDLYPQDLLKAFHLREMQDSETEEEILKTVEKWEEIDSNELSKLFSQYLYRIRRWSKNKTARYFEKEDVSEFKGINVYSEETYPFKRGQEILHYFIEEENNKNRKKLIGHATLYPFQIDQTIINGKRFFEMITYYNNFIKKAMNKLHKRAKNERIINNPLYVIYNYRGRLRTGDKYVKNLFYCGLFYYLDKFGEYEIESAIKKLFIWAYSIRLKMERLRFDTIDNYALNNGHADVQLFKSIQEAIHPTAILNIYLRSVNESKSTQTEEVIKLFEELKYYEKQQ